MYISTFELKKNTLAFLYSTEDIYSPNINPTAQRFLNRLTALDRNSLIIH